MLGNCCDRSHCFSLSGRPAPASMLGPPAELGRRRSHPQDGLARVEQPRAPPGARASATSSARAALMSAVALTRASFATGAGAPATFLNAGYVVLGRSAGAPSVLSATRRRASSAAAASSPDAVLRA